MMKELLAVEQELQEIQEECNKREIEYQAETDRLHNEYKDNSLIIGIDNILKSHAAQNIKDGGNK